MISSSLHFLGQHLHLHQHLPRQGILKSKKKKEKRVTQRSAVSLLPGLSFWNRALCGIECGIRGVNQSGREMCTAHLQITSLTERERERERRILISFLAGQKVHRVSLSAMPSASSSFSRIYISFSSPSSPFSFAHSSLSLLFLVLHS